MPFRWWDDTVTVIRPTQTIERGNPVTSWDTTTEHTVRCHIQPSSSDSDRARDENVYEGISVYAAPNSDIREGDRVRYAEKTYVVDGTPQPWRSPTHRVDNVQVKLKEWEG